MHDEDALRWVVEGTVWETGVELFPAALVSNVARVRATVGAWLTEYVPEQKRVRAMPFG